MESLRSQTETNSSPMRAPAAAAANYPENVAGTSGSPRSRTGIQDGGETGPGSREGGPARTSTPRNPGTRFTTADDGYSLGNQPATAAPSLRPTGAAARDTPAASPIARVA
jgi:hypothetical protein